MKIIHISILKLLILTGILTAQKNDWQIYNTSNSGLPDNQIQTIFIDKNNVKWIGTANGLVRFDNISWDIINMSNSPIPSTYITAIDEDGNGGLWIGTNMGIAHYNSGNWQIFTNENSILKSNEINDIQYYKTGVVWFATSNGVVKYKDAEWTLYNDSTDIGPANNFARSVVVDSNGTVWLGVFNHDNFNGYLWNFDETQWGYYSLKDHQLNSSFPDCLAVDSGNILWMGIKGTVGGALVKIENNNWNILNRKDSGFPIGGINSITIEGKSVWLSCGNGFVLYDGNEWTQYNTSNSGLPDDYVFCSAVDLFGNKWIATLSGGLAVYKKNGIATSIEKNNEKLFPGFRLYENYPNPFNPNTNISFTVPVQSRILIKIYNLLGEEVATLVDEIKQAGNFTTQWDGNKTAGGVYFCRMQADNFSQVIKMILLK